MRTETDMKPITIESKARYGLFYEELKYFTENGYGIISLSQNAESRRQKGENAEISTKGNFTREGILYVPRGKNKFLLDSPILESAEEATQEHSMGGEFHLMGEQLEKSLVNSIDFPEETIKIPINRLNSYVLTVHAFGGEKKAENYGYFLHGAGIKSLLIYAIDKDDVNKQSQPFVRQVWFRPLSGKSTLYSFWGLHCEDIIRAVRKKIRINDKPFSKQNRRQASF